MGHRSRFDLALGDVPGPGRKPGWARGFLVDQQEPVTRDTIGLVLASKQGARELSTLRLIRRSSKSIGRTALRPAAHPGTAAAAGPNRPAHPDTAAHDDGILGDR